MPVQFYHILHILGVIMTFMALGGILIHVLNGGTKESNKARKVTAITHGIGLLLILVSGFGLLAKYKLMVPPLWAILKIAIWLFLGALIALSFRKREKAQLWWVLSIVLGLTAVIIGKYWKVWF